MVKVTFAAEGGALHLYEVTEVGCNSVLFAVGVVWVGGLRALWSGRSRKSRSGSVPWLRPNPRLALRWAAWSVQVNHGVICPVVILLK